MIRPQACLIALAVTTVASAAIIPAHFDLSAIRDAATLETRVIQDWKPAPRDAAVRQKVIEITVCEWWPGQKVRLPITLNAPATGGPCRHVVVANMGLAPRATLPTGAMLRLLKEDGVGVVLVGMGTIDAMPPAGRLHLGMKAHLLATKDARYTPAWIWGMSDMRALTAAIAEREVFQPTQVLATGGSKRGVGAAASGIHDSRFTAIMPVVAPPLGNPGGAYVIGTDPATITAANRQFLADLAAGLRPDLPASAHAALTDRDARRADERISVVEARTAGWSEAEISAMNDGAWEVCRITRHLPALQARGLAFFYNLGTNDSVSPALLELGRRFPAFPLYLVPGGQHGGPKGAGFTRQVPAQREVEDNLLTFARHHFLGARKLVAPPQIVTVWDAPSRTVRIRVGFPDGTEPQRNTVSWSGNRHPPYTLAFEYDRWTSAPLLREAPATFSGSFTVAAEVKSVEVYSHHTHTAAGLPWSVSSPLLRLATP